VDGFRPAFCVGRRPTVLVRSDRTSLQALQPTLGVLAADGTPARVKVSAQDVRDDPTIGGLIVTLRDITERRRLEHEVEQRFVDAR
jgi:PAS domain-containing protein